MASIPTQIEVPPERRNSRADEIIAFALFVSVGLLALCLSADNLNDPSWNAAGQPDARNWIGTIGANVASGLLQGIGLAAYLLPFLLAAASWRRFRSRRINAPVYRLTGLIVLLLSSSALLAL